MKMPRFPSIPIKAARGNHALKSHSPIKTIILFRKIFRENPFSIDTFSFLFVFKACTRKSLSLEGKQLHSLLIKFGFGSIIHLQTSLINVYSASGHLADAHQVFDEMPHRNVVSWTALISAYVDNQKPNKALQLFRKMQMQDLEPDRVTVTVALSACAALGALEMGEWIHAYIHRKRRINADLSLKNALINMYAKCGDVETSRKLFNTLKKKDVTTWTCMIVGHALHGQANEALKLFSKMTDIDEENKSRRRDRRCCSSIIPNDVTFIGVLMACSHGGMLEQGKQHFESMSNDYGLKPRDAHYGCMVDLYCRAGLLKDAYSFILGIPSKPNAVLWRTLLGACSLHGDVELAREVRSRLLQLEPGHSSDSVALSNIYAGKGMWDEKIEVRDQMKLRRRAPGCSSIEVSSEILEFVSGDADHPFKDEIYEALVYLTISMKAYGFSPEIPSFAGY